MLRIVPALFAVIIMAPLPALAASSGWFETYGVRIRLVTEDLPDRTGILRGALEIRLDPGWKTYWMDPGEAGVPPRIGLGGSRNLSGVRILFPAPRRMDDDNFQWAGYEGDVALALEFAADGPPEISAEVFLGVCRTVCVPVEARLDVVFDKLSDAAEIRAVAEAHANLPAPAGDGFGIRNIEPVSEGYLVADVDIPPGSLTPELFLAGSGGWQFEVPELELDGERARFGIRVISRPEALGPHAVFYTLVADGRAVSGTAAISSVP